MTERTETHTMFNCSCNRQGCQFCDGGLGLCTVCGGFEGTLTEDCCGHNLDEHTLDAVYKGGLDFISGEWVVAPKEVADDRVRLLFWKQGKRVAGPDYQKRIDAFKPLVEAVKHYVACVVLDTSGLPLEDYDRDCATLRLKRVLAELTHE